jgi:hypothetical protein
VHARGDNHVPGQLPWPTIVTIIVTVCVGVFASIVAALLWWFTPWREAYHERRRTVRAAPNPEVGRAGMTSDRASHRLAFLALGDSDATDDAEHPNSTPLTDVQSPSSEHNSDIPLPPQAHVPLHQPSGDTSLLGEE